MLLIFLACNDGGRRCKCNGGDRNLFIATDLQDIMYFSKSRRSRGRRSGVTGMRMGAR